MVALVRSQLRLLYLTVLRMYGTAGTVYLFRAVELDFQIPVGLYVLHDALEHQLLDLAISPSD